MNIQFSENRFFLSNIQLAMDHDYETILHELFCETWIPQGNHQYTGQENPAFNYRWLIQNQNPKSKILVSIIDYLQSTTVHNLALESLYSYNPQFEGLWGMDLNKMKRFADWHAYFQKDCPGWYLKPHTDYRRLIATGMIYLTEKDDPNLSTYFYWDNKQENEVRLSTNFGDGWLHVNDSPNIHVGMNKSDSDRYSILIGLTIKHPDDYRT